MLRTIPIILAATALPTVIAAGCSSALIEHTASRLPSLTAQPEMLGLNVFFIERPLGDPLLGPDLWESVDEPALDRDLRRALEENGMRIGVIGGQMPASLETLLGLDRDDAPAGQQGTDLSVSPDQPDLAELARATTQTFSAGPWGNYVALSKGMPYKIVAGSPHPECFVLMTGQGVTGRDFRDARFIFQATPVELSHERVELEFRPEVHHGQTRVQPQQLMAGGAPLGQQVESLPQLTWRSTLTPGQMILLTMWPQREGTLGWHFFSNENGEHTAQRLIVVRVANLPLSDPLFSEKP